MAANRNKLGSFTRLRDGDFPQEYKGLVGKLAGLLNTSIERLYNILNNQLTREENLLSAIKSFTVTVDNNGVPLNSTRINLPSFFITNRVKGVVVEKVTNLTSSSNLVGGPFITWVQDQNSIIVSHITGLSSGTTYSLRISIYGGPDDN